MSQYANNYLCRPFSSICWCFLILSLRPPHQPVHPQSEDVLQHNPLGKVPILIEEDGFSLFESGAINTYLGDTYRSVNGTLVPMAGTRERGLYEQTLSVLGTEMDAQGLWIHSKHERMGKFFTFIPDAVTHARKYFHKTNRSLAGQLKENGGPYLLGHHFTAVDIYYVHCLDWSVEIGWDEKWKNDETVMEYLERCRSRSAYIKVNAMRKEELSHAAEKKSRQRSKL
jgi:glutathione S-transferase